MKLLFTLLSIAMASFAHAITFDEQHCARGNVEACEQACIDGSDWACNQIPDEPLGEVTAEWEMEVGCNPWIEYNEAQNRAKEKLENRPVPFGTPPWVVTFCEPLGTFRFFEQFSAGIKIWSERFDHSCPKSLNHNQQLSNTGRRYTMMARCEARR